jgi:hypothetical protein
LFWRAPIEVEYHEVVWATAIRLVDGILAAGVRCFQTCRVEKRGDGHIRLSRGNDEKEYLSIMFDGEDITNVQKLVCVVIGKIKAAGDTQILVVLVVRPVYSEEYKTYKRVEIGKVLSSFIVFRDEEMTTSIL